VPVKVYSPEKTLADFFKFRNKIGMDVALGSAEALQDPKEVRPRRTAQIRQDLPGRKMVIEKNLLKIILTLSLFQP